MRRMVNFKLNHLKEKEETVAISERSHNLEKALLATIQHRLYINSVRQLYRILQRCSKGTENPCKIKKRRRNEMKIWQNLKFTETS